MTVSMAPTVSVLMNCYNSSAYLKPAIESVLQQTYADFEVVLWDNHSTDGSDAIFRSFGDPRLRYFRSERFTGLGEARNLAARQARGAWLAFLDCDDVWTRDKLSRQLAVAGPDIGLVYGYTEALIERAAAGTELARGSALHATLHTGHAKGALPQGDVFVALVENNFIPMSSLAVRRDVFELVGGFDATLTQAEDYDLALKVAKISKAAAVQEPCCYYRIHAGNASHGRAIISIIETIQVLLRHDQPQAQWSAPIARQLRRHRARLVLHRVRGGDPASAIQLLRPPVTGAAMALVTHQLSTRAVRLLRRIAGLT
jgi:glycosyltransferase involved in cell wall biosynthesis